MRRSELSGSTGPQSNRQSLQHLPILRIRWRGSRPGPPRCRGRREIGSSRRCIAGETKRSLPSTRTRKTTLRTVARPDRPGRSGPETAYLPVRERRPAGCGAMCRGRGRSSPHPGQGDGRPRSDPGRKTSGDGPGSRRTRRLRSAVRRGRRPRRSVRGSAQTTSSGGRISAPNRVVATRRPFSSLGLVDAQAGSVDEGQLEVERTRFGILDQGRVESRGRRPRSGGCRPRPASSCMAMVSGPTRIRPPVIRSPLREPEHVRVSWLVDQERRTGPAGPRGRRAGPGRRPRMLSSGTSVAASSKTAGIAQTPHPRPGR